MSFDSLIEATSTKIIVDRIYKESPRTNFIDV